MSDLISREELRQRMYHEAFETDSDLQKWDSGCWIRYKLFENVIEGIPSVKSQWLSFEESVPLEKEEILVCNERGNIWIDSIEYEWCPDETGEEYWCWFLTESELDPDEIENARWMPLPEPYKEVEND